MNIDTAHPRLAPIRPSMPIEGRSLDSWAYYYDRTLSQWFYDCRQRYATSSEWDDYISEQFSHQSNIDLEPL